MNRHIFLILDCSGSNNTNGIAGLSQINELVRAVISECMDNGAKDIRVVCYANKANEYWKSSEQTDFIDINYTQFGGLSNLGKAYDVVRDIISKEKINLSDCIIALISDGEATDNYRESLKNLDPNNKMIRIALSIGKNSYTTDKHTNNDRLLFRKGLNDREAFIEEIINHLKTV